ncbi:MAG TPA: gamma-glutamyl-gamma-aminobutyrate hydrolase family protein [Bryobacteraceae bacterium]|nr:gamma-glutamyl-gamma-aminobutyrate hydrolase family protein [Bryobacteraceae bacterium]
MAVTFNREARLSPYLKALEEVAIEAVRNPSSLESLDGLLLTGGTDINPKRYGRDNAGSDEVDDARDELELRLVQEALAASVPIFAICRGLQLFNVARGGTLVQHLSSTTVHSQKSRDAEAGKHPVAHRVWVAPGTRLAEIVGAGGLDVNSRHHQAIENLGEGLAVSAISEDGVIEAVELPDAAFAVAVQWHPEDRIYVSEADRKLFEAFAAAIANPPAARRAAPPPNL